MNQSVFYCAMAHGAHEPFSGPKNKYDVAYGMVKVVYTNNAQRTKILTPASV